MAKARTIDDIVHDIVTIKYKPLLKEAVEHVAKQAEKDIHAKAVNVLVKYYYGGYEPESYYRTGALIQSIVPFSHIAISGSGKKEMIECVVGVEYSPQALEAYLSSFEYAYEGSKKWGQPDAEWIIENFLAGKHPTTDGSTDSKSATDSFKFVDSKPMITQSQGMNINDHGEGGTGPSLTYYKHSIFPKAVMNYIMVNGIR